MMELVGVGDRRGRRPAADGGVHLQPGDPSLNHATGSAPHNLLGLPGAYVSDLLLQTFGLAIVLVPVALITWGVRMVRTHHLGFFGLRLSLLLLALLMMSVACVGLGDVGGAATHAGPGGLVGLALVGRFREIVLTHSSGGSLALIEPVCAALAFIAMAPALGMNRTDLPLIFRILRAPFLWSGLADARRRRPVARQAAVVRRGAEPPAPRDRLCRDPGRDRRQPVRSGALRDSPRADSRGRRAAAAARLPDGRCALRADRAAGARHSRSAPATLHAGPLPPLDASTAADSVRERTLFDRLAGAAHRADPGPAAAAPPPAAALPDEAVDARAAAAGRRSRRRGL